VNPCTRFQNEAFTGFPVAAELTLHVQGCTECQVSQGKFVRLEQLLAVAGQYAPPRGFERRLEARLAGSSRRRFSLRTLSLIGSAIAAAVIALVMLPRRDQPLAPTAFEVLAAPGARSGSAAVGGVLRVTLDQRRELRVWRDQTTLVFQCARDGCEAAGGKKIASVPLSAPGQYRAMILTPGANPLKAPVGFDDDARLAREAGASYELVEPIDVY